MTKTALLIVEPDFLTAHVGVRRVILFYWSQLARQGFEVLLATPSEGRLLLGSAASLEKIMRSLEHRRSDAPDWRSDKNGSDFPAGTETPRRQTIRWTDEVVALSDFTVSIVTNPWLCERGLPDAPFTAGIVYDMVPNLLACGALNLGSVIDIYAFAHAHDVGYQTYLKRAQSILCISDSARADFSEFYRLSAGDRQRIKTLIPFDPSIEARVKARPIAPGERPRALLVNVLDPRKNFGGVRETLAIAMRTGPVFDIDVVGRERMPFPAVRRFLMDLGAAGSTVRWYRSASDACLHRLYSDADLLLFPSLYEGLGLPILEAQAHGVPVVSSNSSSCGEVNMNPSLALDPFDFQGLASASRALLDGQGDHLNGVALRSRQAEWLSTRNRLPDSW